MDLRGRPGGERAALAGCPEAAVVQHVDRQSRPQAPWPARRRRIGRVHPHLGEPPRFVHRQLVAPDVGGVIHLEEHVRQRVLPLHDGGVARRPDLPVQVDGLVRHQHLPRSAVPAPLHQIDGPGAPDARPALQGDAGQELVQKVRGNLVDGAGVAQNPRRPRLRQPVLDAPFVGHDVVPGRQGDGVAAGKVGVRGRRRRVRPDGAFGAGDRGGDRRGHVLCPFCHRRPATGGEPERRATRPQGSIFAAGTCRSWSGRTPGPTPQAMMSWMTRPCTSVRRKSRPL